MSNELEMNIDKPTPYYLTFFQEDDEGNQILIGKFWYDLDEKILKFEGEVDKAGEMFVDFIKKGFRLADSKFIDIVFETEEAGAGRFVEVEDETGKSVSVGEWVDRGDEFTVLRILTP